MEFRGIRFLFSPWFWALTGAAGLVVWSWT